MRGRLTGPTLAAVLGGVIGLVAFELSLGLKLADPRHIDWLLDAGDNTTHFLGWHMFRHDEWRRPLGAMASFGYPIGTSVGLTDSIPVFAIPLKAVLGGAGDFQYIGLWLLLCFVLQGGFGALLVATVTNNLALQLLGSALFVMTPIVMFRIEHPALAAHWLLLASLWITFSRRPDLPWLATFWLWAIVVAVAAATHPYIAVMVVALATASQLRAAIVDPGRAVSRAVLPLAGLLAVYAVVSWQAGYFIVGSGSDLQAGGIGLFSMNLLSLLMPLGASRLFGQGPISPATSGQYEGFAYLGAGLLLLAAVCVVTLIGTARRLRWDRRWLEHAPLVLACLALTILALSPQVTAGPRTLFEYSEKWWGPLALFRASGRLFWPVYYALVFGVIAVAVTRFRLTVAIALLSAAVLLQAVDLSSVYRDARRLRMVRWTNPLPHEFWAKVPRHYQHLTLVPTNMCGDPQSIGYTPFALFAARAGMTINSGFAARYDVEKVAQYCRNLSAQLQSGEFSADELYVTLPKLVPVLASAAKTPLACTSVDGYGVCFVRQTYLRWQDEVDITRGLMPPIDDLLGFWRALDAEYRDPMKRPPAAASGSPDQRVRSLARYLTYRVTGCSHVEAEAKVVREIAGARELRLCGDPWNAGRLLPASNETFAFRQRMDIAYREAGRPPSSAHVDAEGEAVWLHEYARLRVSGQSDPEARQAVLATIRSITGR